jgi:hypothetical protein
LQKIEDHPLARKIPGSSTRSNSPVIFDDIPTYEDFLYPSKHNLPTKFTDYLDNNSAPLTVYVHSFTDCTLITLGWSHVWIDAIGQSMIMDAWAKVVDGRESEIPKFEGFDRDPIEEHLRQMKTTVDKSLLYPQLAKSKPYIFRFHQEAHSVLG